MRTFVHTAEAIGATSKKLEKQRLMVEFLKSLGISDAIISARFFSGYIFARYDERTLGVGGATILGVIARIAGQSPDNLTPIYRKHGDLGSLAEDILAATKSGYDLPLAEVAQLFEDLAAARGSARKIERLEQALSRAGSGDVKYIVKLMTGDLRIGAKESLVEEAISIVFKQPISAIRRANMITGDIGETLKLAAQDELTLATVHLFHPLGFMLASPVESAADLFPVVSETGNTSKLLVEEKYDGIRAQVHKNKSGMVRIFSRTLDEVTEFPELAQPISDLPGELILDGEILAWRGMRPRPFTELQKRLGRKRVDLTIQQDIPVKFVAFDILYQNGSLLLDKRLTERKARLEAVCPKVSNAISLARYSECRSGNEVEVAFRNSLLAGHEGIVAKTADSPYAPGRRGGFWFKLKEPFAMLDVVVTGVEYGHGRRNGVLSDYTFAVRDGDKFLNIGKAYSGLTDAEIREYTEVFKLHTIEDQGNRRTVSPRVVLEVAFNNVQKSARYESGYALRFPRIVRIRPDKSKSEIDTLERVTELFLRQTAGGKGSES